MKTRWQFLFLKANVLARTWFGRLLQDFAFGGAGGELTFVATLQKWISPDPLIPPESSSCAPQKSGAGSPEPLNVLF
ncbi:hypothetical protein B1B05_16790 [Domibacillus enclensis]|uniref:Secreted protein n=1 Tax=Domibacillus enclensis TaxID=1017273 RepID=A0ABX4E4S1_9BACI|nr:hypothetical protein B1B05_16790 [Domibacillus enclensis]